MPPARNCSKRHITVSRRPCNADDTNPLAHYLFANCLFNLAKQKQMEGESSEDLMKRFGRAIRAAYRFRTSLPDRGMQREIEADYALMVRGKPEEAIPLYEQLADQQGEAEVAKRANWMLAGIYGGDWGVDAKFVNRDKARERLDAHPRTLARQQRSLVYQARHAVGRQGRRDTVSASAQRE